MKILFPIGFLIIYFLTLSSCKDNEDTGGSILDHTEFLNNIGDNLILKGYEDFLIKADSLSESSSVFQDNPSAATLNDLRNKWLDAYLTWQKVAFYNFGPAEASAILTINYYPVNISLIEDNISSGSYNLSTAGNTFAKGFPALDYLLFGYEATDEAIIDKFSTDENARNYVADLAGNIRSLAENVYMDWSPDGNNYLITFKNNKGTTSGSSLSLMVNSWSQYMEVHVRNAKIGIPNGNSVATEERFGPFPEKSEAYYSREYSKELLFTANESLKDFYMGIRPDGSDGIGIYDILVELDAQNGTLAGDYRDLFIETENQINQLNGAWVEAINNQGEEVTAIFNNYKAIIALLKVDIVSALSISITYTDNDGD